jgi:hypothetical protein
MKTEHRFVRDQRGGEYRVQPLHRFWALPHLSIVADDAVGSLFQRSPIPLP